MKRSTNVRIMSDRNLQFEHLEDRRVLTFFLPSGLSEVNVVQDADATIVLRSYEVRGEAPKFTQAANGQLELSENGDLLYTPNADYLGQDEFSYQIGNGEPQTVAITVWESLYAVPDWFQVSSDSSPETLDVISNDYVFSSSYQGLHIDAFASWLGSEYFWRNETENLTIVEATANNGGSVAVVDNMLTYTPMTGFAGVESLTYVIEDHLGHRSEAQVTVEVGSTTNNEFFSSEAEFMQHQVDEWMARQATSLTCCSWPILIDSGQVVFGQDAFFARGADLLSEVSNDAGAFREIQQGDIVKSDGDFLYYVTNEIEQFDWIRLGDEAFVADQVANQFDSYLTIVNVSDPSAPVVASTIGFDNHIENLFLDGNRVALLNGDNSITVLDTSDPTSPQTVFESAVNGIHKDAQLVDGHLYVVSDHVGVDLPTAKELLPEDTIATSPAPYINALLNKGSEGILPHIVAGDVNGGIVSMIDWSDIQRDGQSRITSISTFDISGDSASPVDLETISSGHQGAGAVYFSSNAIYVQTAQTINKFAYEMDGVGVDFAAMGDLPTGDSGWFNGSLSMNEFEGNLQVVFSGWWNSATVNVYVMAQDETALNVVGSLNDIAPGEQVYSTHFLGNRAYVVTFEQIDPFFVIDLSDPTNPLVAGELKVDGFSNHLLPINDELVIGIGRNADPQTGFFSGLQISLFGVSDPENPVLVDRYSFEGGRSTWSALIDSAFGTADGNGVTFDFENRTLALPIYSQSGWNWFGEDVEQIFTGNQSAVALFNVDSSGITEIGQVDFDDRAERTVLVGDHLVYMSGDTIKVADRGTPSAVIASVDLPKTTREIEDETAHDMNDDGITTPLDALLMINEVNKIGFGDMNSVAGQMHQNGSSDLATKIDVNNDGEFSPMDPLMVINTLNAVSSEATLSVVSNANVNLTESAQAAEIVPNQGNDVFQLTGDGDPTNNRIDRAPIQATFDLDAVFAGSEEDQVPEWRSMSFLDLD